MENAQDGFETRPNKIFGLTCMIDARQVRRNFARAASTYVASPCFSAKSPAGCWNGWMTSRSIGADSRHRLRRRRDPDPAGERYPKAQVIGLDASEAMLCAGRGPRSRWRWLMPRMRGITAPLLAANAGALPLKAGSSHFVWSNLMLHWLADPRTALREMHRVLAVDGLLMFSTFGGHPEGTALQLHRQTSAHPAFHRHARLRRHAARMRFREPGDGR